MRQERWEKILFMNLSCCCLETGLVVFKVAFTAIQTVKFLSLTASLTIIIPTFFIVMVVVIAKSPSSLTARAGDKTAYLSRT
jgi:hypothetical protein